MPTTFRRIPDYITMALGVLMVIAPIVFSETAETTAAYTAYIFGALIFATGLLAASRPEGGAFEYLPLVLAICLFVSPWVFAFTAVTGTAWSAWTIGLLAFISSGSVLVFPGLTTGQRVS